MFNPSKQENVGNARLLQVTCSAQDQTVLLHFDRDVILRSGRLPIQITNGPGVQWTAADAIWTRSDPGVLCAPIIWPASIGDVFTCYIPEGIEELAGMSGGRVLSAFCWGEVQD